jgi:hypothetical protein
LIWVYGKENTGALVSLLRVRPETL